MRVHANGLSISGRLRRTKPFSLSNEDVETLRTCSIILAAEGTVKLLSFYYFRQFVSLVP